MNTNQQNTQTSQPNGPSYQQPGQSSQDKQGASYDDAGQKTSGQASGQEKTQRGREVSAAGRQLEPSSRTRTTTLLPPVDIFEDETGFTVIADLPGVSKDQLGVRVTGDSLVIEGTASVPVAGNMELVYGEVQTPQYQRSFTLSRELDPGKIEAKLNNGVLTLRIPKAEEAKPRRIDVSVG
jgi:HSP20 family protein